MAKGFHIGKVIESPTESAHCVRFFAEFAKHEMTEVITRGSARSEAKKLKVGDRVLISKYADIGYLQIAAKEIARLVSVPE